MSSITRSEKMIAILDQKDKEIAELRELLQVSDCIIGQNTVMWKKVVSDILYHVNQTLPDKARRADKLIECVKRNETTDKT